MSIVCWRSDFFFSSRRRHTRSKRYWSSDVCSSDLKENYLAAMDAGVDDFIAKPLDREQLAARLRVAERVLALQGTVRALEGLIPICSYCKRVRSEERRVGKECRCWWGRGHDKREAR